MKKYSVLMFNFGNYEILREPTEIDDECEYVYVTDNAQLKSNKWTVIHTNEFTNKDPVYASFFVRYHPFKYVTTDTCFIIDGSIQIKKSLKPIYERFIGSNMEMMLSCNYYNMTFGDELNWWKNHRTDCDAASVDKLSKFINHYKMHDYHGCFEVGFKCVKNDALNNEINETVWQHLLFLGTDGRVPRVDQIIFGILFAKEYAYAPVFKITRQAIQSSFLQYCKHNTAIPIIQKINYDNISYLNKKTKVECL